MRCVVHTAAVVVVVWVCVPGCSRHPGTLSKSEVEGQVTDVLKFKDVSLTANPEGGFKGTGTAEDGTKSELTVTQDERFLRYSAKSEKGERKGVFSIRQK
jgi:hypothetical protein